MKRTDSLIDIRHTEYTMNEEMKIVTSDHNQSKSVALTENTPDFAMNSTKNTYCNDAIEVWRFARVNQNDSLEPSVFSHDYHCEYVYDYYYHHKKLQEALKNQIVILENQIDVLSASMGFQSVSHKDFPEEKSQQFADIHPLENQVIIE